MKSKFVGQVVDRMNGKKVVKETKKYDSWEQAQRAAEKLAKKNWATSLRYAIQIIVKQ
jgi:hypothetical protein